MAWRDVDAGTHSRRREERRLPGRRESLIRTQQQGTRSIGARPTRSPSAASRFVVRDRDDKVWVSLRLPRGSEPGPKSLHHDLRIEALAGRDHRLSRPIANEEDSP